MRLPGPFAIFVICTLAIWTNGCSSSRSALDFTLTNLMGGSLKYVYLSPSASSGWEENILEGSELKNGHSVNIRFNPKETAMMWDLRIEGADGKYAEWKNLKLGDISEIKLVFEQTQQKAIADLE